MMQPGRSNPQFRRPFRLHRSRAHRRRIVRCRPV